MSLYMSLSISTSLPVSPVSINLYQSSAVSSFSTVSPLKPDELPKPNELYKLNKLHAATFSPCSNEELMLISDWNRCAALTDWIPRVRIVET
jgi:hypothetical protein